MAYTLTLTDDEQTVTYSLLEVPLVQGSDNGATNVMTISGNIYTDYIYQKRTWKHKWDYMSAEEYVELRGFYDRQFELNKYPRLTISQLGADDVPVVMNISDRQIVNNCGMVKNVEITLRETAQL